MRTLLSSLVLLTAAVTSSLAQNKTTIAQAADSPPPYCSPCVFYSGDFDALNDAADAALNINSAVAEAEVWVPFTVQQKVIITGLMVNVLLNSSPVGTNPTPYGIRKGVSTGNGGELVCSGSADATAVATGRQYEGMIEVTYQIRKLSKACTLAQGTYWMNVEPQYPGIVQIGNLSDVEDVPPGHHFGNANVLDDSFLNSTSFGDNFVPTAGINGVCGGVGCDMFSVGITGVGR